MKVTVANFEEPTRREKVGYKAGTVSYCSGCSPPTTDRNWNGFCTPSHSTLERKVNAFGPPLLLLFTRTDSICSRHYAYDINLAFFAIRSNPSCALLQDLEYKAIQERGHNCITIIYCRKLNIIGAAWHEDAAIVTRKKCHNFLKFGFYEKQNILEREYVQNYFKKYCFSKYYLY